MARVGQFQEIKSRFDEVIEEAIQQGPQVISWQSVEVFSCGEYLALKKERTKGAQLFLGSPLRALVLT